MVMTEWSKVFNTAQCHGDPWCHGPGSCSRCPKKISRLDWMSLFGHSGKQVLMVCLLRLHAFTTLITDVDVDGFFQCFWQVILPIGFVLIFFYGRLKRDMLIGNIIVDNWGGGAKFHTYSIEKFRYVSRGSVSRQQLTSPALPQRRSQLSISLWISITTSLRCHWNAWIGVVHGDCIPEKFQVDQI